MKNKIFIMFFSLIMIVLLGFVFGNETYAKPCPINTGCINCTQNKHDCCTNCNKNCKNCENCCEKCKFKNTEKQLKNNEQNCPCRK